MTQLTVVPFGGLGNRLRVLRSALVVNKNSTKPIKLFWFKKEELYAHFHELFQVDNHLIIEENGVRYTFLKKWLKHIYILKYPKLYRLILGIYYDCILFDEDVQSFTVKELQETIKRSKRVLIATCYQFETFDDYNIFCPEKTIHTRASQFLEENKPWSNIIGVHIRRTDHTDIKNLGGVDLYMKLMDRLLQSDPKCRFLVCSDDQEVKSLLKHTYGEKVIVREVELSRLSETGMSEALMDVLLLSYCDKLIGSARSSFVTLAQQFNKKKELIDIENG